MEQRSPEWFAARCGKVTASRIGDLMARNQPKKGQTVGEWSARRNNYLAEKVAERITGKTRERRKVASLDHRIELEPDARAAYEFYCEQTLELVAFIEHPRIPNAGASPDSVIRPNGGLEIKCPDEEAHIEILTTQAIDRDYVYQMQFNIACAETLLGRPVDWWDFESFNPNMPEELKCYVQRVERDDVMIRNIETNVIEFLAEVDQKVAQVRGLMQNKTPLTVALEESIESLHVVH